MTDTSLAASTFLQNGIRLYPNPAKTELSLTNTNNLHLKSFTIIDLSGKVVLQQTLSTMPLYTINVATIAKGLYMAVVETQSGNRMTSKIAIE